MITTFEAARRCHISRQSFQEDETKCKAAGIQKKISTQEKSLLTLLNQNSPVAMTRSM